MLLAWMGYAMLFAAGVAAIALAAERVAGIWERPRRGVWVAAMLTAIAVPLLLAFRTPPRVDAPPVERFRINMGASAPTVARPRIARMKQPPTIIDWQRPAAAVWVALSTFLLLRLARDFARVQRRRRIWRPAEVDGHRVLVGNDVGPAVVGAVSPAIVLPAWAMSLERGERELMLRHEAEHIRAGDPRLLLAAALVLALIPWNLPLWLIARRLRLAIEIDCDARVMRAMGRPREYGMLLLAVGARNTFSLPLAASLAEDRPLLERRILAMTASRPSRPVLASLPFVALVLAGGVAMAQTPAPPPLPTKAPSAPQAPMAGVAAPTLVPVSVAAPVAPSISPAAPADAPAPAAVALPVPAEPPETVDDEARVRAEREMAAAAREAGSTTKVVPIDSITVWIALHHPDIIRGNGMPNRVTIFVDENEHYVTSSAERATMMPPAIDRKDIESVEVVKGRAAAEAYGPGAEKGVIFVRTKADSTGSATVRDRTTVLIRQLQERAAGSGDPIYVVDGAVVSGDTLGMKSSTVNWMNVDPKDIESVDVLKFQPGRLAPASLDVIVVKLKK